VAVTGLFPGGTAPPAADPIGKRFEGNKQAIAEGKQLFGQMNCSGCHFNGGGGIGPALMSGHWR
jgi:cytochrome c oxidase cbb3-type subunit 3